MQKIRPAVRYTAYFLFGMLILAVVLLVAELILRQNPRYSRSHFVYHPDLIWTLMPGYRGMKQWGDDHFSLRFNRQGFRGPDWTLKKESNVKRLMILGDSYTAGLDVRFSDLYTQVVAQQLNEIDTQNTYEVLSAGTPAWGTDQEFIFWEKIGKQYQPDYLLLMVSPNDVREAYRKGLIKMSADGQLTIHPASMPARARRAWWWANRSAVYQYLQRDVWDTRYGHFWDIYKHYPVHFGKEDADNWDLPVFLRQPFPEAREAQQLFQGLITAFQQSTAAADCQLLLSIIPTKMEFDGTLSDTSTYEAGKVARLLTEIAIREEIPYLNLYQQLADQNDPMSLFLSWDFHMNEVGNAYLAEQLTPFILQHTQPE